MIGAAGLHVYVLHNEVQTGPLSLLLASLLGRTPRDGFVLAAILTAALGILCIRLLELTARPATHRTELVVLVGGTLAVFTWAKLGGYGHLDDAITLTCAVVALYMVRAGLPVWAGVAIGIGIAAKPWGVIFLPLALTYRDRDGAGAGGLQRDWRGPFVACAVAAVAWLPFVLGVPDSLKVVAPHGQRRPRLGARSLRRHDRRRCPTGCASLSWSPASGSPSYWPCATARNRSSPQRSPCASPPTRRRGATTHRVW